MSDRMTVVLAAAVVAGAWVSVPLPRWWVIVVVSFAVAARQPVLVILAATLWASSASSVSLQALRVPRDGTWDGVAQLVSDPMPLTYGSRFDVRIEGRRYQAQFSRDQTPLVASLLAGERIWLTGRFAPRQLDAPWLDARHIAGVLAVSDIGARHDAPWYFRIANGARRTLAEGASTLGAQQRALYTGLVYGDDRDQSALLTDDFRAGGLGHLLAVSGQNVAFALASVSPLVRRVPRRWRYPLTVAVLVLFVLITRGEPSVLRAGAMAAIAALAATMGRTAPGVRVLALAVAGLVCIDPLLVRAVGFQLSVAASLGIICWAPRIAWWLVGPRMLREVMSITLAAQIAVAPIAVAVFGGIPLASLPANLLAGPAAGPVMVWGLTGGVVAAVFGGEVAELVHLPTRLLLWWITRVAGLAGSTPLGTIRLPHVAGLALSAAALLAGGRRNRMAHRGAVVALVLCLVAPALDATRGPSAAGPIAPGVWMWAANGAVVVEVDGSATSRAALAQLRERDVGHIDVLIVRTAASSGAATARDLVARYHPKRVWAPRRHQIRGATNPPRGTQVRVGQLVITVEESDRRVGVTVHAV